MNSIHDAIRLLEKGDWEAAHRIVQKLSTPAAHWAHGIVHVMEGDMANADYWYGLVERTRPQPFGPAQEVAALAQFVDSEGDG